MVVGGAGKARQGVTYFRNGTMTQWEIDSLLRDAAVVVYPSLFEGFGLPVLDALGLGRPVVVPDTQVNRELRSLTQSPDLHLVPHLSELRSVVEDVLQSVVPVQPQPQRSWKAVANEYAQQLEDLLSRDVDQERLARRWRLMKTLEAYTVR